MIDREKLTDEVMVHAIRTRREPFSRIQLCGLCTDEQLVKFHKQFIQLKCIS